MENLGYTSHANILQMAIKEIMLPQKGIELPNWPKFTQYLGGLRPHELTLLCAPTGAGKTAFLSQLSAMLIALDIPHFAAPVETGRADYGIRVLGAMLGENFSTNETPSIEKMTKLVSLYENYIKTDFRVSIYEDRVKIADFVNELHMHAKDGCKVAILDNLNFFLEVASARDQLIEMDHAIHEFVILAKKIPMHIVLVCHPRKTDGGRVESEFDIKGSSTAVQEASNVILLNRPRQEEVESGLRSWTDRELVFKKIRKRGLNVNKPIWFKFDGARYGEYP